MAVLVQDLTAAILKTLLLCKESKVKIMLNIQEILQSLSIKEKVALLTNLLKAPRKYEGIPSLNIKELKEICKNKHGSIFLKLP